MLEHLRLLEGSEILPTRGWHGFCPTKEHLRSHVGTANRHRIHHGHGDYRLLKFILRRIRHDFNLSQSNLIDFHGQDQRNTILVKIFRNRKTLFLQSNKGKDDGISLQDGHGKVTKSPRNCPSPLFGNIDIHPRNCIRTIGIENNPRKLNDFFFLLILSHKILAAEKKSSQ